MAIDEEQNTLDVTTLSVIKELILSFMQSVVDHEDPMTVAKFRLRLLEIQKGQ